MLNVCMVLARTLSAHAVPKFSILSYVFGHS